MPDVVNPAVLIGFALDYLVELTLASNRRAFVRHEWTSLVSVAAQAAALLPPLAGLVCCERSAAHERFGRSLSRSESSRSVVRLPAKVGV
jgi:hypothetical protein